MATTVPAELGFRIAASGVVLLTWLVRGWYTATADATGIWAALRRQSADSLILLPAVVLWYAVVIADVVALPMLANFDVFLPSLIRVTGGVFGLASVALFVWAHRSLGANFCVTPRIRHTHELVTHGPYRHIRHPIYAAAILQGIGFFLLSANVLVGGVWAVGLLGFFVIRVPREEAGLRRRFGDHWREYCRRTGAVWPRLGRQPGAKRGIWRGID